MAKTLSVIVPTYNEAGNIGEIVSRIHKNVSSLDYEIIIVDDNSPDGTGKVAEELSKKYPLKIIHRKEKLGLASAVLDGFKIAQGNLLCVIDSDLSHPPEEIINMVNSLEKEGADIVVASRLIKGGKVETWPINRKIASSFATCLVRPLTRVKDPLSGFFILNKNVIENAELKPLGYKILLEILVKGKYKKVVEYPFTFKDRVSGKTKLDKKTIFEYFIQVFKLYFSSQTFKDVFGSFIVSRLLILFVGYFSFLIISGGGRTPSPINFFFHWDAGWYLNIVRHGYYYTLGKQSNVAFFPFYPMLVWFFSFGIFNVMTVGYIVSNALLFFAGIYLYKLVLIDFKESKIASNAVLFLMLIPVSFFFSIIYSEATFLFFSIGCFYYAVKKKWFLASIFGFCLALTRNVGVLIFIPLLMEYFDINFNSFKIALSKIKWNILYLLLIPAGTLLFMIYLYFKVGDAIAFVHVQRAWNRNFTSIITTFMNAKRYTFPYQILFFGFIIFAILFLIYLIYLRVRLSYIVYSAILLFFYLSASLLESTPRFIGVIFPLYIGAGVLAFKSKFINNVFMCFSVAILTLLTAMFANGYWLT